MHNSTSYSIHGQLTNKVQNGVAIAVIVPEISMAVNRSSFRNPS